ncbi:ATP-binding cassette domain-containing protein [Tepidiforma flava]|uniref:ATP-binding cassette domain-containing protein n=1 Tax=Tepidiforma flava TaxID=3004094 RepID=A0ABY7M7L8_9CHLR|nr:ATP-binding cassette domain-containing protein [Tepidiforma flava]WBL36511.1 ATP-binding cassette domain-containing protein [Tepidiforma flava]
MGVEFDRVHKTFGHVRAVRDLTLEVREGEFLVLVGPSGCGKTTALRMVAGLEEPTSGDIRIDGRSVLGVEPRDRDIAMVFQSYALYPHMSVYDNLAFGLRQRKTPKADVDRRIREVAEMLEIGHLLNRRPRELSGGQRQRVALGRAIARRPRVFLMDEPLSNLDAQLRLRTRAELSDLHRRLGTTLIYVTHDQVEAMTMGTRIAVMHDGVLQQVATPQLIYDRPANTFVASFIGSPAMNLLRGDLVPGPGAPVSRRLPSISRSAGRQPSRSPRPLSSAFGPRRSTAGRRPPRRQSPVLSPSSNPTARTSTSPSTRPASRSRPASTRQSTSAPARCSASSPPATPSTGSMPRRGSGSMPNPPPPS